MAPFSALLAASLVEAGTDMIVVSLAVEPVVWSSCIWS